MAPFHCKWLALSLIIIVSECRQNQQAFSLMEGDGNLIQVQIIDSNGYAITDRRSLMDDYGKPLPVSKRASCTSLSEPTCGALSNTGGSHRDPNVQELSQTFYDHLITNPIPGGESLLAHENTALKAYRQRSQKSRSKTSLSAHKMSKDDAYAHAILNQPILMERELKKQAIARKQSQSQHTDAYLQAKALARKDKKMGDNYAQRKRTDSNENGHGTGGGTNELTEEWLQEIAQALTNALGEQFDGNQLHFRGSNLIGGSTATSGDDSETVSVDIELEVDENGDIQRVNMITNEDGTSLTATNTDSNGNDSEESDESNEQTSP